MKRTSIIFKKVPIILLMRKSAMKCQSLADEVPFDIPDSWEWVRIRSLGEIVRGSGIKRNKNSSTGSPVRPLR